MDKIILDRNIRLIRKGLKMKRYINAAVVYGILALIGGVFFREFTKYFSFNSYSTLSVLHTHYFVLGMVFLLILGLLEKNLSFTNEKTEKVMIAYHIGLNLTVIMLFVRGIFQVRPDGLTHGIDAMISGIAGVGHLILGVSLIILLLTVKRSVNQAK